MDLAVDLAIPKQGFMGPHTHDMTFLQDENEVGGVDGRGAL